MENEYLSLPAETKTVDLLQLKLPKAFDFASCFPLTEIAVLVKCHVVLNGDNTVIKKGDEIVVFEVAVDVGAHPINDIRYTERIAVVFTAEDKWAPWVFALRKTFPKVLHRINLYFEKPTCLCIYETAYKELKLEWRSQRFLEDIRNWLALTAEDKLHQDDQPLEPLLAFHHGRLILPHDLKPGEPVFLTFASNQAPIVNLVANRHQVANTAPYHLHYLIGEKQKHGLLDRIPTNLYELHEFLERAGINLLANVQELIRAGGGDEQFLQKHLLLLVQLPKTTTEGNRLEHDIYAFATSDKMIDVGYKTNTLAKVEGHLAQVYPYLKAEGENASLLPITIFIPYFKLSRESAGILTGDLENETEVSIAQIGVGALGSQIFINLSKTWFGKWKLIDEDILLPHNTIRHHLNQQYCGRPKSMSLAHEINTAFEESNFAVGIWDDYLNPRNKAYLTGELAEADVLLDVSTSIPVARDLAHRGDLSGRRISMFLNPAGTDFVILSEDQEREFRLDVLEYQYYRKIINEPSLDHHLDNSSIVRYSNSCRDITSRIPQDNAALHAAIGSKMLKKIVKDKRAMIGIWQIREDMRVEFIGAEIADYVIVSRDGWSVYIDKTLIDKIAEARLAKLPNETGGILIGGYDFERKIVYLVDTVLAPSDSIETPTSYTPGKKGLKEITETIFKKTAGHLVYAGEWHSHPVGCKLTQSDDDKIHFADIEANMAAMGYPPLMLIAGDNKSVEIHLN